MKRPARRAILRRAGWQPVDLARTALQELLDKLLSQPAVGARDQTTLPFAPALANAGGGAALDVHTVLSWLATTGAYSPSKAAFWGLTDSLRLELAAQGTQILGAHLGYATTSMTARLDVPKSDPADIVGRILDALAAGADEAHADATTLQARSSLSSLTTGAISAPARSRRWSAMAGQERTHSVSAPLGSPARRRSG